MSQVDRALKSVETYPNSDGKIVRLRGLLWYQVPLSVHVSTNELSVIMTIEWLNHLS